MLPKLLSATAVTAAEIALRTPARSNRLFARLFSATRSISYWQRLRSRCAVPGAERLLTLCYHSICDRSDDPVLAPYGVLPSTFIQHLDQLGSAGFSFATPDEVADFLAFGAPLPRRPVLLTFDDCYEDLLGIARDVLHPRGIKALAFAVTGMETGTNEWDQGSGASRQKLLSAEQLRELAALGIEVGSHSRSHREMPLLDGREQEDEADVSADELTAMGLPRPRFFAYPFGAADEGSRKAAEKAGYVAAFGCHTDCVKASSNRFELPRVGVYAYDRGLRFRLKVAAPNLFAKLSSLPQRFRAKLRRPGSSANGVQ